MNIKFDVKIKETAKLCAKAKKDFVAEDPKEDGFIEKLIAEAKSDGSDSGINKQSNSNNK